MGSLIIHSGKQICCASSPCCANEHDIMHFEDLPHRQDPFSNYDLNTYSSKKTAGRAALFRNGTP